MTENCVENTDFAYAAASRPGHMPRQLPARLSGIRSIGNRKRDERLPDLCFAICRFSRVVFIPRAQPHARSLFLFPIVFGVNLIHFFCGKNNRAT